MKKLKVGIIGLGVGEQHIAGYNSHPACEVVSLCDISKAKLDMAKEKYPDYTLTDNAEDILNDPAIDVVSIASYDNYHYAQIMQALSNDKHVFVEKPLCLYQKEAVDIRKKLAERHGLKLSSNLILRMSPRFRYLKKIIDQKELGDLFYIEGDYNYGRLHKLAEGWRGKIDFYSVIYGGGVHIIDLMLWLTGDEIIEAAVYGNNISSKGSNFKYNDIAVGILKFKSGMVGKLAVNMGCVFPHFHNLVVYGTKKTFINGIDKGLLFESRDPKDSPVEINKEYPGVLKGDLIYSFVEAILGESKSEVDKEAVFRAMSVCFALERSMTEGKAISVEYV